MAQQALGFLYFSGGLGLPEDAAQCAFWYEKAARQGNALAQRNLSRLYHDGTGFPGIWSSACSGPGRLPKTGLRMPRMFGA